MEKVFEVFILYMDMVASFGHVTRHDPVSNLT